MINLVIPSLDNDSRKRLLSAYQKHALHEKLVSQVSEATLAKKSPLKAANKELVEIINKIYKFDAMDGGRTLKTTGLYLDDDVFEKGITNENTLGLTNKKSRVNYMARVYDKTAKGIFRYITFGQLRIKNTSIVDFWEILILFRQILSNVIPN
jgi:hypothetical protein